METVILGVDPGSRIAGYACLAFHAGKGSEVLATTRVLDAGVLKMSPQLSMPERLGLLHEGLYSLMRQYQVKVCVLEKAFSDKNISTAIKLGEVRGAIMAAASRVGAVVDEITPAEVKKTLTGNGRADKDQVSRAVQTLLGVWRKGDPYDMSDAMAIGLSFSLKYNYRNL